MAQRLACILSLLVFAACLVAGFQADNTFSTTVSRALIAMAGTFVVGLIVGSMAQKMLNENIAQAKQKLEKNEAKIELHDR